MASKSTNFIHHPLYFSFPTGPPQRTYLLASNRSWLGFGAKVLPNCPKALGYPWGGLGATQMSSSTCSYITTIEKHPSREKSQELVPFQLHA